MTSGMHLSDTRRVIVDITVQPKNAMFPTDAKADAEGVRAARPLCQGAGGFALRQSYGRIGTDNQLFIKYAQRLADTAGANRQNPAA